MSEPNEPLSPTLARLVEAERSRPAASDALRRRLLERLDASVIAGAPFDTPRTSGPAAGAKASLGRGLLRARTLYQVALFGLGAAAGAALHAAWPRAEPQKPALVVAAAPVFPAPAPPPVALEPPASPIKEAPRAKSRVQSAVASGGHDDDLASERALLEVAYTALARGQAEATIAALRQHAQKYPHGRLAEERDSLWVVAFVQAELYPEARRRAEQFRRRYPNSMLSPAVDDALKKIP